MSDGERDRLLAEVRRFRLAESDMEQAEAAARFLATREGSTHLRRAVEAGLAVCYARPFTLAHDRDGVKRRIDPEEWRPHDPAHLTYHVRLLQLRSQLYAHNDATTGDRDVLRIGELFADDELIVSDHYTETYREMGDGSMPEIATMIVGQRERFREEANRLQAVLAAGAPIDLDATDRGRDWIRQPKREEER
jgi:hypothetical protein